MAEECKNISEDSSQTENILYIREIQMKFCHYWLHLKMRLCKEALRVSSWQ